MSKMSKRKGYRGEYIIRKKGEKDGYDVTWHNEDPDKPDATLSKYGIDLISEIKYRASVPKTVYNYLNQDEESNCVIMKRVSKKEKSNPWLIVMELDRFTEILERIKK